MNRNVLITLLINLSFYTFMSSQSLDEETGFIYVKAEYLLETGRYDEAVTNYNQVITKNPGYKNALIHRGKAKYALGAYKGTKNDAMQSIELKGITPENASLLGRALAAMGESDAAINSFTAAILLDPKTGEYLLWRAQVFESSAQRLKACSDYEAAARVGNSEAIVKAKNYCGVSDIQNTSNTTNTTVPVSESSGTDTTVPVPTKQESQTTVSTTLPPSDSTTVIDTGKTTTVPIDDSEPVIPDETIPKNDDTVNEFVVDDDLKISVFGQELGNRKIKETPSILILSDENGKVAINICVNKEGQVIKAEFNANLSTILQKSLVSLALRKAKEFEFVAGKYDSQCGIMIFEIKGS